MFLLPLWELHIISFEIINSSPLNLPRASPISLPTNFMFPLHNNGDDDGEQLEVVWLFLVTGSVLECGQYSNCSTVEDNGLCLSQQWWNTNSSSIRGVTLCPSPFFHRGSVWVQFVKVLCYVSSYVPLHGCICKTLFPWSHPPAQAISIFLPPQPHRSLILKRQGEI